MRKNRKQTKMPFKVATNDKENQNRELSDNSNQMINQLNGLMGSYFNANKKKISEMLPKIKQKKQQLQSNTCQLRKLLVSTNSQIDNDQRVKIWNQKQKIKLQLKNLSKKIREQQHNLLQIKIKKEEAQKQVEENKKYMDQTLEKADTKSVLIGANNFSVISQDKNLKPQQSASYKRKTIKSQGLQFQLPNANQKSIIDSVVSTDQLSLKQMSQLVTSYEIQLDKIFNGGSLRKIENFLLKDPLKPISRQIFTNYTTNKYFSEILCNQQLLVELLKISEL